MTTDRRAYKIDPSNPGSDLAGETAAAMAAASLVFRHSNPAYANTLITHAQQVSTNPSLLFSQTQKNREMVQRTQREVYFQTV